MKRWPIIRHVRYLWHAYWLDRWVRMWAQSGIGVGPAESDLRHLERIWRGEA